MWDLPPYQALLKFGERFRVIVMDKRGTGLSDRTLGFGSLHERTEDIRAVLDAVGSKKVILYGVSESGPMTCYYAAKNPERVRALMLFATMAYADLEFLRRSEPECHGIFTEAIESGVADLFEEMASDWGSGVLYSKLVSHPPDDAAALRVLARFERNGCTPQIFPQIMHSNFEIDVRPFLPMITAPTLVMHCTRDPIVPVEMGRELGKRIPGAQYQEIDADFHGSWRASKTT
jgi:pimeloyl-ACP methyl ester carboxylesterase